MPTSYPGSLDSLTTSIAATDEMDDSGLEHDLLHNTAHGAINAVEAKVGTGASTAVNEGVLGGTGSGTSAWTTGPTLAGTVTAAAFAGPLTGNVTGNASGTAATVTGAAQSAITSVGTLTSATISGDLTVGTSNAQILGPASGAASAGNVSFSFKDDTDTGFFRWNTNTFSAATAGATRMTWAADGKVGIGDETPTQLLDVAGNIAANSTGTYPVVIGVGNPSANPNGSNVAVGTGALSAVTSGDNVAVGIYALRYCTTSGWNVAVGNNALGSTTTQSGHPNYAQYSVAVGHEALYGNVNGSGGNVAMGFRAGKGATTGIQNTFIGMQSNQGASTGSNNTCIGYNSATTGSTTSNEITLGNSSISALRCQVDITVLSDERDKTDIEDFGMGLDFVRRLRPVRFVWDMRDGGKVGIPGAGFIAQELQQAQVDEGKTIPNLILDENPDKLEASPSTLIPALVLAIQELSDKVDALT